MTYFTQAAQQRSTLRLASQTVTDAHGVGWSQTVTDAHGVGANSAGATRATANTN